MSHDTPQSVEKLPGEGLRERAERARAEARRLCEEQRLLVEDVRQTFERFLVCRTKSAGHDRRCPS